MYWYLNRVLGTPVGTAHQSIATKLAICPVQEPLWTRVRTTTVSNRVVQSCLDQYRPDFGFVILNCSKHNYQNPQELKTWRQYSLLVVVVGRQCQSKILQIEKIYQFFIWNKFSWSCCCGLNNFFWRMCLFIFGFRAELVYCYSWTIFKCEKQR